MSYHGVIDRRAKCPYLRRNQSTFSIIY